MSKPREIQLLKYKDDGFELDVVALQSIVLREDIKDLPVVLFSVAGPFRTGKSFIMNYFLRYLNSPIFKGEKEGKPLGEDTDPLVGFSWRGGSTRNTIGILMWSEPVIKTLDNGDKVAVLLIDTQGLFDDSTTMRECSIIFALSTLLSSVQIYNIKSNIQENHLQFLQLFTQYAKLADGDDSQSFQNLLFLIRDWVYYDTHPYGNKGGDDLVTKRFELTQELSEDMVELRKGILGSFENVTGFLLPHPGFNVMKPTFDGRLADLEPDFKTYLLELVTLLFSPSNLIPKQINGEVIKAKNLPTHFNVFLDLFKNNETLTVTSMTKAISDISLQTAGNEAREAYEKSMNSKFGIDMLSVPGSVIRAGHTEALDAAKALFNSKKQIESTEEVQAQLDKLVKELDVHLMQYLMMNETKLRKLTSEANKLYSDTVKAVHGSNPLCLHPADLESVHEEALKKAVDYFQKQRQPLAANVEDPDKIAFVEKLKKNLSNLQIENENNTRTYISEVMLSYGTVIETYLSKEYAVEDEDFLKKHNRAKSDAIEAFKGKRNRQYEDPADEFVVKLSKDITEKFILLEKINKQHNRKAFKEAYELYEAEMSQVIRNGCCYSKEDFKDIHEQKKRTALTYFHPRKSTHDDYQKGLLSSKIDLLYQNHNSTNDWRNSLAISQAIDVYKSSMDEAIKPRYMWLLIVPMITSITNRYQYHEEATQHALRSFRSERCSSSKYDYDEYYSSLISRLRETYRMDYAP